MRHTPLLKIMSKPVITVKINEPFSHVEEKFRIKGIRHLPVIDDHDILVGLLTQRDLFRTVAPHKDLEGNASYDPEVLNRFILKNVMTKNPTTLTPNDSIEKAVRVMAENRYGCMPIVDPAMRLAGIITEIDILKFLLARFKEEG